jgi:5-methylcytosine-specific restriction endonuclease McrA
MRCPKCSRDNLSPSDFYNNKNKTSGLTSLCSDCLKSNSKRIYKTGGKNEYLRNYRRERYRLYPEIPTSHKNKYKARKMGNGGSYSVVEWNDLLSEYRHACPCCKRFDVKLVADHIHPVSRGGSSNITNIQPLCVSCNASKAAKRVLYTVFGSVSLGSDCLVV